MKKTLILTTTVLLASTLVAPGAFAHATTENVDFTHPNYDRRASTGTTGNCGYSSWKQATLNTPGAGPLYAIHGATGPSNIEQTFHHTAEWSRDDVGGLGVCGTTAAYPHAKTVTSWYRGDLDISWSTVTFTWDAGSIHDWMLNTGALHTSSCDLYLNGNHWANRQVDPVTGTCEVSVNTYLRSTIQFEFEAMIEAYNPAPGLAELQSPGGHTTSFTIDAGSHPNQYAATMTL